MQDATEIPGNRVVNEKPPVGNVSQTNPLGTMAFCLGPMTLNLDYSVVNIEKTTENGDRDR